MTEKLLVRDHDKPVVDTSSCSASGLEQRDALGAMRLMNHSGNYFSGLSLPRRKIVLLVALKESRVKIYKNGKIEFNGLLSAGTAKVLGPAFLLAADIASPGDVLVLSFESQELADALKQSGTQPASFHRVDMDFTVRGEHIRQLSIGYLALCGDERMEIARKLLSSVFDPSRGAPRVRSLPAWRLRLVENHLRSNLHENVCLAEMAAVSGLSKMHFAAAFRAATSYSPHEFAMMLRVEVAKELLVDRDVKIVDVALSVGYQTQAHFSTVFKSLSGHSPAQWRKLQVQPMSNSGGNVPRGVHNAVEDPRDAF